MLIDNGYYLAQVMLYIQHRQAVCWAPICGTNHLALVKARANILLTAQLIF